MNKIVYKFWVTGHNLYSKGNEDLLLVLMDRLLNIVKRLQNKKNK